MTTEEDGTFRRTMYMERVSIKLEMAEEPMTVNAVKSAVGGTRSYVGEAIETLIHEGYVTASDGPNRSKNLASTRPYREADDPVLNKENEAGESVGRQWFGGGSRIGQSSGDSGGSPPPFRGVATEPPAAEGTDPEIEGWFDSYGALNEPHQGPPPNEDVDWT